MPVCLHDCKCNVLTAHLVCSVSQAQSIPSPMCGMDGIVGSEAGEDKDDLHGHDIISHSFISKRNFLFTIVDIRRTIIKRSYIAS
jgi:hypothetical protein